MEKYLLELEKSFAKLGKNELAGKVGSLMKESAFQDETLGLKVEQQQEEEPNKQHPDLANKAVWFRFVGKHVGIATDEGIWGATIRKYEPAINKFVVEWDEDGWQNSKVDVSQIKQPETINRSSKTSIKPGAKETPTATAGGLVLTDGTGWFEIAPDKSIKVLSGYGKNNGQVYHPDSDSYSDMIIVLQNYNNQGAQIDKFWDQDNSDVTKPGPAAHAGYAPGDKVMARTGAGQKMYPATIVNSDSLKSEGGSQPDGTYKVLFDQKVGGKDYYYYVAGSDLTPREEEAIQEETVSLNEKEDATNRALQLVESAGALTARGLKEGEVARENEHFIAEIQFEKGANTPRAFMLVRWITPDAKEEYDVMLNDGSGWKIVELTQGLELTRAENRKLRRAMRGRVGPGGNLFSKKTEKEKADRKSKRQTRRRRRQEVRKERRGR